MKTAFTYKELADAILDANRGVTTAGAKPLQQALNDLDATGTQVVCLIDMAHSLRSIDASLKKLVRQGNEPEVL